MNKGICLNTQKKDTNNKILSDTKYFLFSLFFSCIICIIPFLLFSEDDISNNLILNNLINTLTQFYPKIEFYAQLAYEKKLYFTIKLQLVFGIISFIIGFIFWLIFFIILYLNNLGYFKLKSKLFYNKNIKNNSTIVSFSKYIAQVIFILIIFFLIIILNDQSSFNQTPSMIEHTRFGSYFISSLLSASFSLMLASIFVETFAQLRKLLIEMNY